MIVVQNHIPIRKEYKEQFEKMFIERTSQLEGFPGFIRNEVMRPVKGEDYVVMTYWDTMENFQKWMESDAFKKAHSGTSLSKDAFAGENHITIHEIFTSSP